MEKKDLKKTNLISGQKQTVILEKSGEEAARKKELLKERVERIYHSLHLQP